MDYTHITISGSSEAETVADVLKERRTRRQQSKTIRVIRDFVIAIRLFIAKQLRSLAKWIHG